ncbi:hypothetical protein JOD97_000870 [Duganella sp. 1411]|uniref:hypothetical protein n=1 Tax=Duganella sp. 1411 TaxID=2806572 RepID=UPI001AE8C8C7|nr:hypothetical protein [Duganella sp. 1411]MBP1202856.1 hypothetical protein [Duganella sp. 1411]
MKNRQTDLITELTKRFIDEIQKLEPAFVQAFFRFYSEERMYESCSSYTTVSDVHIISALMQDEFFDEMNNICVELLTGMDKNPALLLLTIDKDLDYEIKFEYEDMEKWRISLADGGTGTPTE